MRKTFAVAAAVVFLLLMARPAMLNAQAEPELTNARVIEMSKAGLGDDIIVARVKTAIAKFSLGDNDLVELKKAGVSDKIVAAMVEASVLKEPKVLIGNKQLVVHMFAEAKMGGRLGSAFTYGIKSVKWKAYLQGNHASIIVSPDATILMELPRGDSPENYVVARMDKKDDRRELEVASGGGIVGGKQGLRAESIVRTSVEPVGPNRYKLVPSAGQWKPGPHIIYILGALASTQGNNMRAAANGSGYDFDVE